MVTLYHCTIVNILHKSNAIIRDVTLQNLFYVYFDFVKFTGLTPPECIVIAEVKKYFESIFITFLYTVFHNPQHDQ